MLKDDNESFRVLLVLPNLLFSVPVLLMSIIQTNFFNQSLYLFLIAIVLIFLSSYLLTQKNKIIFDKTEVVVSLPFTSKVVYLSEVKKIAFFTSDKDKNKFFLGICLENGKIKTLQLINNKKNISEIKELQEYFEENNLKDKIFLA